jgi:hypothetical protein
VIELFRKNPIIVEMILWDGSSDSLREISEWVGTVVNEFGETEPGFKVQENGTAQVYDALHHSWIDVYIGHRVVAGQLGEFYPINPEAVATTYTPVSVEG